MEQKPQIQTPLFNLIDIALLDVSFNRANVVNGLEGLSLNPDKVKQEVIVNVTYSDLAKDLFAVFLTVEFKIHYEEQLIVSAKIVQSATFNKVGTPNMDALTMFANINGPAIIFPFIREMIATLTAKSLLGTVLLQPVNFVQLYNNRKPIDGSSETK